MKNMKKYEIFNLNEELKESKNLGNILADNMR